MNSQVLNFFNVLFMMFLLAGCSKEYDDVTNSQPITTTPLVEVADMTPTTIKQFESVTFFIKYTDGDGNVGDEDADAHALEILDTRDSILHTFHVPPQSPIPGIAITNILEVELKNIILLDQSNDTEEVTFQIRLRDTDFNWSAVAQSPTLTINK